MQGLDTFQIRRHGDLRIRLNGGSAIKWEWTKRAIEWMGFRLSDATDDGINVVAEIDLLDEEGWMLRNDLKTRRYNSIHELVSALPAGAR